VTGQARDSGVQAALLQDGGQLSPMLPAWLMPVRSPLTSAMNTGTPMLREVLGQGLQRDGLAGAGGAGDQAVAVGQAGSRWHSGAWRSWQSAWGSAMVGGFLRVEK
jgi:hypothetical protein